MNAIFSLRALYRDWLRRHREFTFLRDQELITNAELRRASSIIDWIHSVVECRPEYLERHELNADIHHPQAIWKWTAGNPLYDGFRILCSKDRHVLNYLRMWTQHFTGYRLLSMEHAGGKRFPDPTDISAAADAHYQILAGHPDDFVTRYRRICGKLPAKMHVSPPPRFGEVGWNVGGKIVNHDTCAYQERIALLYDCGAIGRLQAIAKAGGTPRILEIGAGFGGLAYHLQKLVPQAHVALVDIPESLVFSAVYLSLAEPRKKHVYLAEATPDRDLDSELPGYTFVPNFMFDRLVEVDRSFDIAINTLSMSEMEPAQVAYYSSRIQQLIGEQGGFFEQNQDNSVIGKLDARRVIAGHFPHQLALNSPNIPDPIHGNAHVWSNRPWQLAATTPSPPVARCA